MRDTTSARGRSLTFWQRTLARPWKLVALAVGALILLLAAPALAQDGDAGAIGRGAEIGLSILELLSPVLLAILGWVSVKLAQLIRAKVQNEMVGGMLVRLNDSVWTTVKNIEQTVVRQIKASKDPNSPGGTKVTKAEGERIKAAALEELKSYWGPKGLSSLGSVLGLGDEGLGKFLESKIEAAVHDSKQPSVATSP